MSGPLRQAWLLYNSGQLQEARRIAAQFLAQHPHDADAMALLANICSDLGEHAEATAYAREAAAEAPEEEGVRLALARVELNSGRIGRGIAEARRLTELDPQNVHAWHLLCIGYLDERKLKKALHANDQSLRLDPDHEEAHAIRSQILTLMGRREESLTQAFEALRHSPDDSSAHATKAFAELRAGKHRGAANEFAEALRINPHNYDAAEGLKEALRHRIWPYKMLAAGAAYFERFSRVGLVLLFLGFFVMMRTLAILKELYPWVEWIAMPFLGIYLLAILHFVIARPLINITLLAHPLGRLALTKQERIDAYLGMPALVLVLISLVRLAVVGNGGIIVFTAFLMIALLGMLDRLEIRPFIRNATRIIFSLLLAITTWAELSMRR